MNKKIAIMQPYFFPYIGYWQLLNSVNCFVIYDDVSYIKQGFINRNSIVINAEKKYITLQVFGASSNKKINQIFVGDNSDKLVKTVEQNYKKSRCYDVVFPMIERVINNKEKNLARYVGQSIKEIASYLDIKVEILYASDIDYDREKNAQDKVINICKILGAKEYINSIGGQSLYEKEIFYDNDIDLRFLKSNPITYEQFGSSFIPNLSIIDVLMFNTKDTIKNLYLNSYELV